MEAIFLISEKEKAVLESNRSVVIVVNASDGRAGNGIREFLEYYILVILDEGASTQGKIIGIIQERSSDNTQYRPGSTLQVADEEVEGTVAMLLREKCIKRSDCNHIGRSEFWLCKLFKKCERRTSFLSN